jgi:hypothetical protein
MLEVYSKCLDRCAPHNLPRSIHYAISGGVHSSVHAVHAMIVEATPIHELGMHHHHTSSHLTSDKVVCWFACWLLTS